MHIDQIGLPTCWAYLVPVHLKLTAFINIPEQPVAKVDAGDHRSMHGNKTLQALIDLNGAFHPMKNTRFIGGWIEVWVWLEIQSDDITGSSALLFVNKGIRNQL